jgi:hypothetical protein
MNIPYVRRAGITCLALVTIAVLAVPIAHLAASPSSVLEACINPGNGGMRLVDAGVVCHANEVLQPSRQQRAKRVRRRRSPNSR